MALDIEILLFPLLLLTLATLWFRLLWRTERRRMQKERDAMLRHIRHEGYL